jgi:hypothetical protein
VSAAIEAARARATDERSEERAKTDLERRFDEVVTVLKNLDIDAVWEFVEGSELNRRADVNRAKLSRHQDSREQIQRRPLLLFAEHG